MNIPSTPQSDAPVQMEAAYEVAPRQTHDEDDRMATSAVRSAHTIPMDGAHHTAPSAPPEVGLVSVNVGLPRVIGRLRSGEEIVSGIVKEQTRAETLFLDTL